MSVATTWGTRREERSLPYPCDPFIEQADAAYYRGITIRSQPEVIFRWLCQMRVAPYSYDWIDNRRRQSPRDLIAGLDELAIGQPVMRSFDLVDFEPARHLTIRLRQDSGESRFIPDVAISYLIVGEGSDACRLLVKIVLRHRAGPVGWLMRIFLPWGDLVMMRRQLLNFKALSEQMSHAEGSSLAR